MQINLYTRNACQACAGTKRQFDQAGIQYNEINVEHDENNSAQWYLVNKGYRAMPVVEITDEQGEIVQAWAGMNMGSIRGVIESNKD